MKARDLTVLMVLGVVALMAAFYLTALKPKRDEVKTLTTKVGEAHQRLDTANQAVAAGTKAKTTYRADFAAVARLAKAVPADDDMPSLVFQLERAAQRAYVDFRAIELASTASAAPAAPATAAGQVAAVGAAEKGKSGGSATTPAAPATQPAAATQSAAAGLPPGASVGAAGFPTMPFDFSFSGRFLRLEQFFRELDRLVRLSATDALSVKGRLLTIDGFALAESKTAGFPAMTASNHATSYLLPDSSAAAGSGAATPAVPGAVSNTTTSSSAPTPVATAGVGR